MGYSDIMSALARVRLEQWLFVTIVIAGVLGIVFEWRSDPDESPLTIKDFDDPWGNPLDERPRAAEERCDVQSPADEPATGESSDQNGLSTPTLRCRSRRG